MEAEEENGLNLKRHRAPLSDSEDNILSSSDMNDRQKRRRLEAAGQENCSPKASSSGRLAELQTKPDTPMIPSVRSRVQQLTQQREGGAPQPQRCLSDPGSDSLTVISHKGFKEQLLGEGEFNQRMERFKLPVFQTSPTPAASPTTQCLQTRSSFVSNIHHKLQDTTTPSTKQASRIRQEREKELNQLQFQPISENAWLKRSSSDPLLTQANGDNAEMRDGSFTEALASDAEKPSVKPGQWIASASEAAAASAECESSSKVQKAHDGEETREPKVSVGNAEEHVVSQQPETVLLLSFSEDQSFSKAAFSQDQNMSELSKANQQSFLKSTFSDSDMKKEKEFSKLSEELSSDVFSLEEDEKIDISYSEEDIEPSTDEELKMWRYPQVRECKGKQPVLAEEEEVFTEEGEGKSEKGCMEKEKIDSFTNHNGTHQVEVSAFEVKEDEEHQPKEEGLELGCYLEDSVKERDQENIEPCDGCCEGIAPGKGDFVAIIQEQKDTISCAHDDDMLEQSKVDEVREDTDLLSDNRSQASVKQTIDQTECTEINGEIQESSHISGSDRPLDHLEMEHESGDERQDVADELTEGIQKAEGGDCSKKVTFILEPELINSSTLSESNTPMESRSDNEISSHDETNTAEIIDQMFEEVLEYAGRMEEERRYDDDTEDRDSGIGACSVDKDKMDTESEKEKSEEEEAKDGEEEYDESKKFESNADELLTFPPSGILSPLSKSVEAVVTPLRLAVSQESNPPSLLLTPEETSTPPAESAPLYSIDAYRTQRLSKLPTIQSVTPGVQRRAAETSKPQPAVNAKEKITALNEEAGKLQTVINQTLQALSCCTDEEHGRGSLEEAEAEKLLLVSCEKRVALLAEVSRLREERSSDSGEAAEEDRDYVTQQPCRGTVSITNIQLPLKVEFVCSSHNRAGRPSHYFFVLIRYGPCNIVATPLATAADAQNGDTISFPTSVTLKDIRSSFEIDVEVYSLSHTAGSNSSMDRTTTTKSRVTPRKLLNTITRSSNSLTTATLPALNTRRSSNFCLVGSHKITLASLGHSKFPLDKMKLDGKIRRLLGDEFQEKVPFLSPLEGNIYLKLESESHCNVQHQGFLTMFELISGYGVWHRRYFVLEGCKMNYWNHPNDKETKEAEGSISLSSSPSQCVRPVKRDSCARPFTFELVSNIPQQEDHSQDVLAKCWFSADTKQERLHWMEKLNQALLDFHTWNRSRSESQQSNVSSSGNLRESIL